MDKKKRNQVLRKNYKIFLESALIVVLALFITAMKVELRGQKAQVDFTGIKEVVQIKEVQRTVQKPTPPPVLPPSVTVQVPNNVVIKDPIKFTIDDLLENPKLTPPASYPTGKQGPVDKIFVSVQRMPKLLNRKEFYSGIKYPRKCQSLGIEGTVYIRFIVTKSGAIKNANVLQGIGGSCDEYALNYLIKNADFSVGRQRGIPVSVKFTIPITFNLK